MNLLEHHLRFVVHHCEMSLIVSQILHTEGSGGGEGGREGGEGGGREGREGGRRGREEREGIKEERVREGGRRKGKGGEINVKIHTMRL